MANAVIGELLQFVRRPVAEIERARGAQLKRIAGSRNMIDMQLGAAIDQPFHGLRIKVAQFESVTFDAFKKARVADQRDFDGFDVAGAFVARRQGREHFEVIDDRERNGEGADEILFGEGVDPIFDADARIVLAERCGGNADMAHAAMCRRGGQANDIEQSAAADGDNVRMAIHVITVDVGLDFGNVKV